MTSTTTSMTTLTSAELEQCRRYVEQTGNGVIAATNGLSDAQWNFKPAPDRWSVAEILEHVVFIQELVLGPIRQQLAQAPVSENRDYRQVDTVVVNQFPDRSVLIKGPEITQPTGRWTPAVALELLAANGEKLCTYVESTPDLRLRVIESRPLIAISKGEFHYMDGYQWVLGVAAHNERHTKQIREVQADPHYPA